MPPNLGLLDSKTEPNPTRKTPQQNPTAERKGAAQTAQYTMRFSQQTSIGTLQQTIQQQEKGRSLCTAG
jgi:hypothetical protein